MVNAIKDNLLLDTEEKYQQMAQLFVLKLAVSWLEKQDWMSSPYGGQNPAQDLLFQTQLTANRMWEDFFSKRNNSLSYDENQFKEQFGDIGDFASELNEFFNNKVKSKLENSLLHAR